MTTNYSQVIQYPRVRLHSESDFDVEWHYIQPTTGILMSFLHVDVYYWSHNTLKRLREVWQAIRPSLPPVVYTQGVVTDAKWEKFIRHFGFEHLTDCPCTDGVTRQLYVHRDSHGRRKPNDH